ncbi:MAG: hypothetical protein P4L84_37065 [Isosphaeraceae bacterium]|nr:hypothetical protein [Isosphaeraceae bacterium]
MRSRAYRPEAPGCLEDRSLLSAATGPSTDPVVISGRQFSGIIDDMQNDFERFAGSQNLSRLRMQLQADAVLIPFGRVDGLGVSINRILVNMRQEIAAGAPAPVISASNDVAAVTRALVEARIQAGDVILD